MKFVLPVVAAALVCSMPCPARAETSSDASVADRYREAMKNARWTGPLLASNANTLPKGHVYTEPYFFDVISGGDHHPGSSGFYQYGLKDNWTVGMQPFFSWGTQAHNREIAIGDFKLLSQVRVSNFTPDHRVPSVGLVTNLVLPTGKYDHLGALKQGHGSGSFAPEIGVNVQQYFLLGNRLLRGRINILHQFPLRTDVRDRSVYGTAPGFRGHARPGAKSTLIVGAEYSLLQTDPELLYCFAVVAPGQTTEQVERGVYAEIQKLQQEPPSGEELQRAKNQVEAAYIFGQDSNFRQAMLFGQAETTGAGWRQVELFVKKLRDVKADDVKRVAHKYLVEDGRTVGILIPTPTNQTAAEGR